MGNIVNSSTGASAGQGLWRATGSNFEQIFRTGQVIVNATGFTANTTAAGNDNQAFLDCDGVATYIGTVAGPGVTYLNELALMQETPEGPVIVARARQPAPGTPTGIIFTTSSLAGKFVCANDEAFAFTAQVQGTGVTASNDRGVWYVQNGQPELIFREGMQIEDQLIAEITGAGDHLQVSDTGRVIVKAHLVPVANPFGARSAAMISWAPCEGPTILARLGGPMLLEGGLSQTVHNFSSRTEGMMNRSSEVVLAVTFASSQERDEKVVKFPPVNCNPPCPADFDNNSTVEVSDIFAFLSAWFAQNISADANENGSVAVDDIFAFLSAWFEGC
jgi:hypothetical protein